MAVSIMNLIRALVLQLRETQALFFEKQFKMAASGHFGFRFLPISIGTSLYSMSVATSNMKLIGAFLIKL